MRALFEQRLASTRPLSCSGCTRSARSRRRARSSTVSSTASASRCAASTRWRRSTRASAARSATRSCRARAVCYVLDSWLLRHYASDFLADSELFADSRSCWWQRRRLPTRSRLVPRVARRDGAVVSPQATGVRGVDQDNAQVLRRRARSEEPHAARLPPGRGRAADGAGGARRLLCSCERAR